MICILIIKRKFTEIDEIYPPEIYALKHSHLSNI